MLKKIAIKFTLICLPFSTPGYGADWQSDSAKSSLQYAVSFEQSPVKGTFKEFSVAYAVNEKGKPTRLQVKVSIASADMSNSDINEVISSGEWFNVDQYPQAIFASDNFKATINSGIKADFIARGILQLKGFKRSVSVPFRWQEISEGKASMTGNIILNRADFSIGTGEWASGDPIGLPVKVWFEVLLTRSAKE
jgi:polyisoprenoid-binding protein YceI